MNDLGFILASWLVTLVAVGGFAASLVRRARRMARRVPPEQRPWT